MITKKLSIVVLVISLAVCISTRYAAAAELSKADATKILVSMGYTNVVIAALMPGTGSGASGTYFSPNVATVIAYGERDGSPQQIIQALFYDKDLGWLNFEVDTGNRRVRLWTTTGYQELKPAGNK